MLSLRPNIWVRSSNGFSDDGIKGYRVEGMPYGTGARIGNFGTQDRDDWRILRISHTTFLPKEWTGSYPSAQEALMVLQHEVAEESDSKRFEFSDKGIIAGARKFRC
jgi:hypothetical protein